MTDDEIIAVVQARKEGKQIQAVGVCEGDRDINWRDVHLFYWDFQHYNYRVKPESRKPREWNLPYGVPIIINPDGTFSYATPAIGSPNITVREVITINGKEVIWCE